MTCYGCWTFTVMSSQLSLPGRSPWGPHKGNLRVLLWSDSLETHRYASVGNVPLSNVWFFENFLLSLYPLWKLFRKKKWNHGPIETANEFMFNLGDCSFVYMSVYMCAPRAFCVLVRALKTSHMESISGFILEQVFMNSVNNDASPRWYRLTTTVSPWACCTTSDQF
jgi:hypothetical protein